MQKCSFTKRVLVWCLVILQCMWMLTPTDVFAFSCSDLGNPEDGGFNCTDAENGIDVTTLRDVTLNLPNFNSAANTQNIFNLKNGNFTVNAQEAFIGGSYVIKDGILSIFSASGLHILDTADFRFENGSLLAAAGNMNKITGKIDATGFVLNEGKFHGTGDVAFVGKAVENKGTIDLPANRVFLGAGKVLTVGLSGDNLVSVVVDEAVGANEGILDFKGNPIKNQIENSGNIKGHKITLNAKGVDSVFEKAINLKGEIKAVDVRINKDGVAEFISQGELELIARDDIYSKAILDASKIKIRTDGDIDMMGVTKAKEMDEQGASFQIGGKYFVESGKHDNADQAITYAADTIFNGIIQDDENIVIGAGVTVTLAGSSSLIADSDAGTDGIVGNEKDGTGSILMSEGSKIIGGGFNLTFAGSGQSILREITGVDDLTFNAQTAGARFTLFRGVDINGDLKVNSGAIFDGTFSTIVRGGDVTGDGVINMTGGIFEVFGGGQFGGSQDWNFNQLQFGDGESEGATYKTGTNDITIGQDWIINESHTLFGGANTWDVTWRGGVLKDIAQIATGQLFSLAVSSVEGFVYSWGYNEFGQLGDGTTETRLTPVKVKGLGGIGFLSGVKSVRLGTSHALALMNDNDQTVVSWGSNVYGQLGNNSAMGEENHSATAVQVLGLDGATPLAGVKDISAGRNHSLALLQNKTMVAWGKNEFGQLGDGINDDSNIAVQVKNFNGSGALTNVAAISAGGNHSLALLADAETTVVAWGKNDVGQLGDGTNDDSNLPVYVKGFGEAEHLTNVTAISAGRHHSLALLENTGVAAWGGNAVGQLGDGTFDDSNVPLRVQGVNGVGLLTGVKSIAAGGTFSLALLLNKTVAAWGENSSGQLGEGTEDEQSAPVLVKAKGGSGNLSDVKMVAAGYEHGLALLEDGGVLGWGGNYYGTIGDGTNTNRVTPVETYSPLNLGIVRLTDIIQVAASRDFTLALRAFDGAVFSWGHNGDGSNRLGEGANTDRFTPVRVRGVGGVDYLIGAKSIAAGAYHGLAIVEVGGISKVVSWGDNQSGQLGDNTLDSRDTTGYVKGINGIGDLQGVHAISAGAYHNLGLMDDGSVVAWGLNDSGALGDGSTDLRAAPVQVIGLDGSEGNKATAIAAGAYHSLALIEDETVLSWGSNEFGQLGNNTEMGEDNYSDTPVQVVGLDGETPLEGVKALAAGARSYHSLALLENGAVLAWGLNDAGQLGNDSDEDSASPVQVAGLDGSLGAPKATAIAVGGYHSLALLEDSSVASWGANWFGELGDNTTDDSATFVQMKDAEGEILTGVRGLAAGDYHSFTLFEEGTLSGIGANYYGQLGNNSTAAASLLPVSPGTLVFSPFLRGIIEGVTYGTFNAEQSTVSYSGDVVIGGQSVATRLADGDYFNLVLKNKVEEYVIRGAHAALKDIDKITRGKLTISGQERIVPVIDKASQGTRKWDRMNEVHNLFFGKERGAQSLFTMLFGGADRANALRLNTGVNNFEISPADFGGEQGVEEFRKAIFSATPKPLGERKDESISGKTGTAFSKITGSVKVVAQDGMIYDAKEGMNLQKGDQVWTGAGAKVELATEDGKNVVTVKENSAVSVDKNAADETSAPQDLLQIAFGQVSVVISGSADGSSFAVQTPTGISGQRG